MLSVRELQRIATSMSEEAFAKQLGPFVLVQRLPDTVTQQRALQLGVKRTVALKPNAVRDALSLIFEFDDLMVATLPPLADAEQLVVGRLPDCDVVIDDPSVSKHHARLSWSEPAAKAFVEDLGSSNGTTLNGERVAARKHLHDGDELYFGDARYCFLRTPTLHRRLTTGRFPSR